MKTGVGDRHDIVSIVSMDADVLGPPAISAGIEYGIPGLAKEQTVIRVDNAAPGQTGSDMRQPGVPSDQPRVRLEA